MKRRKAGKTKGELLAHGYHQDAAGELRKAELVMRECTSCNLWFDHVRQIYVDEWLCWACGYKHATGKKPPLG